MLIHCAASSIGSAGRPLRNASVNAHTIGSTTVDNDSYVGKKGNSANNMCVDKKNLIQLVIKFIRARVQVELVSLAGAGRLRSGLAASGAGEAGAALFRLAAVVVHVGGPRSGHFATYRRGNGFEAKRCVIPLRYE